METEQRWESLPPMSTERLFCAAAAVGHKVYVFGGSRNRLSSSESFDVHASRWTSVRSMPTKRSGCTAAAVGGRIFVCGGYDGRGNVLSSVEAFDATSGTWSPISPMTTKRGGCSAAVLEGRLYVCGGRDGRNYLSTVECYDPRSEAWSSLPSMTTERAWCAAAVVGGRLCVCGGWGRFNRLSSVEAYNARSRTWTSLPSMSTARFGCSATVVGDRLYVCGGEDGSGNKLSTVEAYDEQSERWTPVPSMATKRAGSAAASVEGRLFVVGGYDGTNRLASAEAITLGEPAPPTPPTPTPPTPPEPASPTPSTPSDHTGLQLIKDVKELQKLLWTVENEDEANEKLRYCKEQTYPSPNLFELVPDDGIKELLLSPDQRFYAAALSQAADLLDRIDRNLMKPESVRTGEGGGRLAEVKPHVMDHTIREPATNTPYGHSAELKYLVWRLMWSIGVRNFALSGLYYGDSFTVEEQFLHLLHEREGPEGMEGGFVMCGPGEDDRATAMKMIAQCRVPNVFFDTTLTPTVRFDSQPISAVGQDIIDAVKEADGLFADLGYPKPTEIGSGEAGHQGSPMGHVYVNLVDIMECLDLQPTDDWGGSDKQPKKYMRNQANVEDLEEMFEFIKEADSNDRITGILFEEGRGRAYHTDYACIAAFLRKHFPSPRYRILLHAHGGTGTEHAASLDAVVDGADGVWAGFIPQAAQAGHNSYFLYLDNLISNGNEQVWPWYDLHVGVEVAKTTYSLNFNTVHFPDDCPIWGRNADPTVHTAFVVTNEDEWRSKTQGVYHIWSDEDKSDLNRKRSELADIEQTIQSRGRFENYRAYRIAPLVTDATNIGKRMGELGLIRRGRRTVTQATQETGNLAKQIMLATMNAGIRVNYDNPEMLQRVSCWVESIRARK